jgi:hypothetical protein
MDTNYADALRTAAAEGASKKPFVRIVLEGAHAFHLRAALGTEKRQTEISWNDFLRTVDPVAFLLNHMDALRSRVIQAL